MFKQRLLTAFIVGPLLIWGILALSTAHLAIVFSVFILIGAWEWSRLAGLGPPLLRAAYVLVMALLLWLCWRDIDTAAVVAVVPYVALGWWLLALLWILSFPYGAAATPGWRFVKSIAGILVLVPAWLALLVLRGGDGHGEYWLLFVLVLIWVADSGAYVTGRRWGTHKLAPRVSPGKTWEGVYGALALVLVYATAAGFLLGIRDTQLLYFVGLSVALVPVSVVGDLFESMIKRHHGLKDSGHLFPGHGGMLDRIDSLTAAAPVFVLGLMWLKIPL